jgi:hypothetical protein
MFGSAIFTAISSSWLTFLPISKKPPEALGFLLQLAEAVTQLVDFHWVIVAAFARPVKMK